MPPRGLPGNSNLEQLRNGAKSFQRTVRAGDAGAADVVREFHPRLSRAETGSPELVAFTRADAQLVIARRFGFPSWPRLKAHLELVEPYSRSPHHQPTREPLAGESALADEFLRLACLTYGGDDPERWARAGELLETNPQLATTGIHTIAAVGEVAAARELLERDPSEASAQGGPHRWEPLLYLSYSRLRAPGPGRSALEVARLLLAHGADPNAGYLWEGLSSPFTALTGAFGTGEGDQPPHPDGMALARLLLEHGADANDSQALYNRQWDPDDTWLALLFEFGLGSGDGGPWHRLLSGAHASPRQMLEDLLISAVHHGFEHRVRLLLEHGVVPEGIGTSHPIYQGRAPAREAALWGYPRIAALLGEAGAAADLDDVDTFLAACMMGERARTRAMVEADPAVVQRARERSPDQLVHAAERDSVQAVKLLIDLGFDVNALNRTAPLHEAAMRGNLEVIRLLLAHGADPNLRDRTYHATPAGWAEHHGHAEAEQHLAAIERDREDARAVELEDSDRASARIVQARRQTVIDTGLQYVPRDPVRVRVVHRQHRISVSDDGQAIERAGRPKAWRETADRVEEQLEVNISQSGAISLPVVRVGPVEEQIVHRIAEASLAFYQELLELEG